MEILAGSPIEDQFTLRSVETGEAANADTLPTAVLVRNGTDTAETVTIANVTTGIYLLSATIPADWVPYDLVGIRVRATVDGVLDNYHVWQASIADPALATSITLVAQAIVDLTTNINRLLARLGSTPATGPGSGVIGPVTGGLIQLGVRVRIAYPGFQWNGEYGTITGYAANSEYLIRTNNGTTIGVPSNRVIPQ